MISEQAREEYYSRVAPIMGRSMNGKLVAVCNLAAVAGAAERLAGCGALRWALADNRKLDARHPLARMAGQHLLGRRAAPAFAAALTGHNTWEDGWDFIDCPTADVSYSRLVHDLRPADLILGGGTAEQMITLGWAARALNKPAVLVALPAAGTPRAVVLTLLPDQAESGREPSDLLRLLDHPTLLDPATDLDSADRWFAWLDANAIAAQAARALLLEGATMPGRSLRSLFAAGKTAALIGASDWPWSIGYVDPASSGPLHNAAGEKDNAERPGGPIMVIGCGSLGSVAARDLVAAGAREIVLLDGDHVVAANPVRQFFSTKQVGQNKAAALARNLATLIAPEKQWTLRPTGANGVALEWGDYCIVYVERMVGGARGAGWFGKLLDDLQPSAALLATGTQADYAIAEALRVRGVPHTVGRCYPRARYFEALAVDGAAGPCFSCLRGHLYTGPSPAPTPEEQMRYSRPLPGATEGEAMPATVADSGRAADVLARLTWALALSAATRPAWLRELLAAEQTCLLGGNETAAAPSLLRGVAGSEWAYGIALPGQVVAYGREQIIGAGDTRKCHVCGRVSQAAYRMDN